jgi:L-arabinose isomerase
MRDRAEMTGEWLAWCQSCSVPEIANVFNRARMSFFQITDTLQDDAIAWREIDEWVDAARVASVMEHNRSASWSTITAACSTLTRTGVSP